MQHLQTSPSATYSPHRARPQAPSVVVAAAHGCRAACAEAGTRRGRRRGRRTRVRSRRGRQQRATEGSGVRVRTPCRAGHHHAAMPRRQQPRGVNQKAANDFGGRRHVGFACEPSCGIAGQTVRDREKDRAPARQRHEHDGRERSRAAQISRRRQSKWSSRDVGRAARIARSRCW